ncbi:MAG: PP2C family protein-serine/threonine phosphatase, partial [Geminicoccaceae bacterium]
DYASGLIIETLGRIPRPGSARSLLSSVDHALDSCHRTLIEHAAGNGDLCGSTVVALLVFEWDFAVVWAGDSRLYRLRHGCLEQLTRDHSYVQELVADGKLAASAARHHPLANRITRAVGADQALKLDVEGGKMDEHDLFLLCSDGLTGMIDDLAIQKTLVEHDLETAADQLIARALAAGGRDNVTVLLIRAGDDDDADRTLPGL